MTDETWADIRPLSGIELLVDPLTLDRGRLLEMKRLRDVATAKLANNAENLKAGRKKGAQTNKMRAEQNKTYVQKFHFDHLTNNPEYARKTVELRADYICKKLAGQTFSIDGTSYPLGKMVNGKDYSRVTIKDWITGITIAKPSV